MRKFVNLFNIPDAKPVPKIMRICDGLDVQDLRKLHHGNPQILAQVDFA